MSDSIKYEIFTLALVAAFGSRLKNDTNLCEELWAALSNIVWRNSEGKEVSYSFRGAGALIARLIDDGDYLDWYCCRQAGVVSDFIKDELEKQGWFPVVAFM